MVDVKAIGAGPRAYDLAEALLVGAGHGHVTESAGPPLWAHAAGLDRRESAACADSAGLTMAGPCGARLFDLAWPGLRAEIIAE
ncbi:MAG TPA: hypothetical protein VGS19_17405 [Streptosporangiaceae bacterium]|nr:hypothetical protein [Streptosporangiaceae bacterium]